MKRRIAVACAVAATALAVTPPAHAAPDFTVLVFSKTAGFRHDSIPAGISTIQQLGQQNNFTVETTEDAAQFTDTNLARFDAVVWLSTTGDVLNTSQQAAFERYIRAGGGYAGVHAASDTEYDWPWYGDLVGSYFASHPAPQQATIDVHDRQHASTAHLPAQWSRFDEWYNYRDNPRGRVHVLATLNESTYSGGTMGADHPIAWCHGFDGGRSWYTGGGHTRESFAEPLFRDHLLGGIRYAAQGTGGCGAAPRFTQVTLAKGVAETGEPMGMTVLPNRGVLHTSRDGTVRYTDVNGNTKVALTLPVYTHDEEGLQSIKADPGFATNRWVYLYYAPPLSTPPGDAPATGTPADFARFAGVNRLARFTVRADHTIDPASAVTVLEVPTSRGLCCHVGGDIDFDAAGNLYLSTGDDTNPFDSGGYTPIDERAGRNPAYDAQRTSANSNDLRGKILRVRPSAGGGYTIPAGNMFAPGTANTRPEIYAMGFRNPFRMSVDKATGVVYVGDYGPDAGTADPGRGPAGQVEFSRITGPGFHGWPYCSSFNDPYVDYTFPSGPSGAAFDCAGGPVNDSPNNTGIRRLPPAQRGWLPYTGSTPPELGGGSLSPMAGPVYRYDPALNSSVKFPASYDGLFFAGEFGRRWIKTVGTGTTPGPIAAFPWTGTQVMDMEFGPDGALYVLDYGTGWFGGDANSAVYRIEHTTAAGRPPVAQAAGTPTSGRAPLTVAFSSAGSGDPDGDPISYAWDFTTDGTVDSTAPNPSHTYTANGSFTATLTVSDGARTASASVPISVGNSAPTIRIELPANGQTFAFGDEVPFRVVVADAEDPAVDCSRVKVDYILGHDTHGHPITSATGCSGVLRTTADGEHDVSANIFGVVNAEYADSGSPPLTARATAILQPRTRQAEHFGAQNGITVVDKAAAVGGRALGYIDNGDWVSFTPYSLAGVTSFTARVASAGAGGTLSLRTGSPTGPLLGSVAVAPTGGWENFVTVSGSLTPPAGTHTLYLVFTGGAGSLFDVDEFAFGQASPPSEDVARNRPATASSVESAAYPASAAVDGDPGTRWSSQFADPQWIQVDLGATGPVSRVKLTWETAYGSGYQVRTSTDGATWTTVRTVTGGDGGVDDLTGLTASGRYVRVHGTARATGWGYSLWSFEVYR
ncbi:ThuA domain-containing protein [Actinokineospora sp. UTMC 2448]|uniref:ThuA domain-containing protein n=1 Tax=Actinokineospora sp. UTMC 2448 TaxID=2268449 RepID=UPI0021643045|nr:ThuA domain-containing protein [Actinokineospora sp. UTMC 2448]UVS78824.1 Endo-1,4-beta-xylanase A precursor [Actinokineospora sp. UTMC 2448]